MNNYDAMLVSIGISAGDAALTYIKETSALYKKYSSGGDFEDCINVSYSVPKWTIKALKSFKYADNESMKNAVTVSKNSTLTWDYTEYKRLFLVFLE